MSEEKLALIEAVKRMREVIDVAKKLKRELPKEETTEEKAQKE